ncbi:glycosyltransferase family 4 protein [Desulfosediminicola flagellatus]|uniref:glycosyltransferase family 4 protein n=1 Tax=Desulfosediminicola flagellatus TaxID=2569541 RepID=UPI0010AD9EDF|nr:glycosyltransferase family 1 protein [Desulfosediminicola flagellatus]
MRLGINALFMVPGDVGGTETYLRETLLAALKAYPDVEFILFTNNENHEHLKQICKDSSNVRFVCLHFNASNRPVRILLEQFKLPFVAKKYELDVLWSPGYTAPFISFYPQAVTICDLQYKSYPEDMSWLERNTLDVLVRGACRMCEVVLAISEFSRQEVIRYEFAGPEKVHTVLLGVDVTFGELYPEEAKNATLGGLLELETPYILCVAHTYPHKKVHVLIDAFNDVMESIPHNLVIVGRARRGEDLVASSVSSCKDRSRVIRFKDGLPYRTLQMLYQSADMFVLPSAYEGFGLPVVEAMMAGVPVITTQEASLKEVAGEYAFRVNSINHHTIAEQILKVESLPQQERTEMTDAAKSWAETFTWLTSAQTMFEVFQKAIRSTGAK